MNTGGILSARLGLMVAASPVSAATCESLREFSIGMGAVTGADSRRDYSSSRLAEEGPRRGTGRRPRRRGGR